MEWTSETISFSLLWLTILCFQHTQGFWEIHIGFDSLSSTHRSSSTSHNHSYHLFSSINTLIQTITLNTPHPNLLSLLQQQLQITFPTISQFLQSGTNIWTFLLLTRTRTTDTAVIQREPCLLIVWRSSTNSYSFSTSPHAITTFNYSKVNYSIYPFTIYS